MGGAERGSRSDPDALAQARGVPMHLYTGSSSDFNLGRTRNRFKSAILHAEAHTQRLYNLLLTNPELASMIETTVMKATNHSMRSDAEG